MSAPTLNQKHVVTMQATLRLRVIRDDNIIAAFSADFRKPDRLQRAWLDSDGSVEWRDVEVVSKSVLQEEALKRLRGVTVSV